jgi:hypothetical protein
MSRGRQTFKQIDVTKALKATVNAGITVARVEIDKEGKIVVVPVKAGDETGDRLERNEWDAVLQ